MELDIIKCGRESEVIKLTNIRASSTVTDIKHAIHRMSGKAVSDSATLQTLELKDGRVLYYKDLGPQIGWKTVFLAEYAGPLFMYLISYSRPFWLYGSSAAKPMHSVVHIAAYCWALHYTKRIVETLFVHRFSHATMPILNLFKNCSYYWGFAFFIGYYINHPLYTPPCFGNTQIYTSLVAFIMFEIGNLSIHIALRNLRPPGTHERRIPMPDSNPFTLLFNYVSCPNYAYEWYSWAAFSIMAQSLPALMFTVAGFVQMSIWALAKHRNYKKEFKNYPRRRKAIVPFLL